MELQLGYSGFCQNAKKKKKCFYGLSRMFIFTLRPQHIYAPDESLLFWSWKNPKYPQLEPHAGIKNVQVLGFRVNEISVAKSKLWGEKGGNM